MVTDFIFKRITPIFVATILHLLSAKMHLLASERWI